LYCPSDDAEGHSFSDPALTNGKRFSKGNYAAFCSPVHLAWTDWWPGGLSGRHFYSPKNITDGITKTLLLSEVRTRENEQDQRGAWALPWAGASLLAFDMHSTWPIDNWNDWMSIVKSNSVPYQPWSASFGETQLPNNLGPNVDILYANPDPIGAQLDGMPCALFNMPYSNTYLSAAPRSRHMGGVNVAFLDGRISFLSDDIDELTMAYLISSNDGQSVDLSKLQ
jgi:prepilin-type processing-associated H-X9-DG protein